MYGVQLFSTDTQQLFSLNTATYKHLAQIGHTWKQHYTGDSLSYSKLLQERRKGRYQFQLVSSSTHHTVYKHYWYIPNLCCWQHPRHLTCRKSFPKVCPSKPCKNRDANTTIIIIHPGKWHVYTIYRTEGSACIFYL